jgi:hypothetical protein
MQKIGEALNLSAGDLVGHLNCRYLTELDLKVANGELKKPKVWDPVLETLAERGALHEQGFIEHIKLGGIAVTVINGVGVDSMSVAATGEAMARGEAPIVIYSMTTSSHSDAPRGMEFLYSANRLNVATSRAKCVVVASPRLFEAECRTPRQMQLANAFCRYLELATPL